MLKKLEKTRKQEQVTLKLRRAISFSHEKEICPFLLIVVFVDF